MTTKPQKKTEATPITTVVLKFGDPGRKKNWSGYKSAPHNPDKGRKRLRRAEKELNRRVSDFEKIKDKNAFTCPGSMKCS